jgi:hypothetical protein
MEDDEIKKRLLKKEDAIESEWDALRLEIDRNNRPAARSRVDSLLAVTAKRNNLRALLPPGPEITVNVTVDEKVEELDGGGTKTTLVIEARPDAEEPEPSVDEIIADAEELLKDFPEPKPKRKKSKKSKE